MKKIVLSLLCCSACASSTRTIVSPIEHIVMQDADAYILFVRDASLGVLRPKKFYARDVKIVCDVPLGASAWAEYVDVPDELRGEGDRLVLHVRTWSDVEH